MAARFINSTDSHLFLTGKAGTGKTTFLRHLADKTHKSYLIGAPLKLFVYFSRWETCTL